MCVYVCLWLNCLFEHKEMHTVLLHSGSSIFSFLLFFSFHFCEKIKIRLPLFEDLMQPFSVVLKQCGTVQNALWSQPALEHDAVTVGCVQECTKKKKEREKEKRTEGEKKRPANQQHVWRLTPFSVSKKVPFFWVCAGNVNCIFVNYGIKSLGDRWVNVSGMLISPLSKGNRRQVSVCGHTPAAVPAPVPAPVPGSASPSPGAVVAAPISSLLPSAAQYCRVASGRRLVLWQLPMNCYCSHSQVPF